ncbi:hypothetical protein GP475_11300 [Corynebacterium poyangense]|uniref:Type I restriction modification DNA specificity domain-containing protein n=1 Tax=Corynebacterium poyangense TaxID=2684405 RepID=A0A7H0SRH7_9CORY|nr:restriction endonuclease subunit S [Corynebacterium poyangense]QNQ91152.1 hypothetical protein GP475_11300 [Corynebacterium poyangense]
MTTETMKNSGVEWIGNIPREWSISRLKDCLEIRNGKEVETDGGDIPVYGSGGVFGSTTSFLHDGESILFGRKGTIDKPLLAAGEFWTVDTMFYSVLRGNDNLKYLYYAALCLDFKSRQSGSTLPSMTQTALGGFFIPRPKLQEQQIIAAVLDEETGKIDQAIHLLQQELETMEQLKKSLIYEAVTKGLDPSVPMKPSGVDWIGDIPEHWQAKRLKYLCMMKSGDNLTSNDIADSDTVPVYGGNGIRGYYSMYNNSVDRVLIGRQGALCGNVHFAMAPFWATDHAIVVTEGSEYIKQFAFYALLAMNLNRLSMTAAQPGLAVETVMNEFSPLPSLYEQETIVSYLESRTDNFNQILAIKERQLELLQQQRQSLIFEYVTGKRRVSEVA